VLARDWDGGGTGLLGGPPRIEDTYEFKKRKTLWWRELYGGRRHLSGMFREVYEANLLSEAHVHGQLRNGTSLLQSGLGAFEELDPGLWLWEVPREQIPLTHDALAESGLLICP